MRRKQSETRARHDKGAEDARLKLEKRRKDGIRKRTHKLVAAIETRKPYWGPVQDETDRETPIPRLAITVRTRLIRRTQGGRPEDSDGSATAGDIFGSSKARPVRWAWRLDSTRPLVVAEISTAARC